MSFKSLTMYNILLFMVIIVWIVIGFNVIQYTIVLLYLGSVLWYAISALVLASMIPPITLASWKMKQQVDFFEPDWNFQERDVSYSEFKTMMSEYSKAYSHLMVNRRTPLIIFSPISFGLALLLPQVFNLLGIQYLQYAPYVFGLGQLLFGLTITRLFYNITPNEATPHFPYISSWKFRLAIPLLYRIQGASWVGIRLSIGEAGGFYTIRNPCAIARIEGIESVAYLEIHVGFLGVPVKAVAFVTLAPNQESISIEAVPETGKLSDEDIEGLVQRIYEIYVGTKGMDDYLEEILQELGIEINQAIIPEQDESPSADDLISDDAPSND